VEAGAGAITDTTIITGTATGEIAERMRTGEKRADTAEERTM
jgi:hypothetical protein